MTAASGGPGEKPDYEGQPPSGYDIRPGDSPPADPAYGGWQPAVSLPTAGFSPPPAQSAPGYPTAYSAPPPPPYPGYPPHYGAPYPGGYGYPGYPGYPMAAEPGTNVLAIVSLVGSVSGLLCFIGSLVGIITGVVAISQVKRTGEKGFGLAVAGTAAGVAGLLLYLVMVAYALTR